MKILPIAASLLMPIFAIADPGIIVCPESPYFEFGQTNTFLISITNNGTNNIIVPGGMKLDSGIIVPNTPVSVSIDLISLSNGIPVCLGYLGLLGVEVEQSDIEMELIEKSLKRDPSGEDARSQLAKNQYLQPQQKVTYRIRWNPGPSPSKADTLSMVNVVVKFRDFDIKTPSINQPSEVVRQRKN
jgi:hypothetical protein